jgi:hypothetical protein
MKKVLIAALFLATPALAQGYDNSQGEGDYNGSNSKKAGTYYNGGGRDVHGDGQFYDHSGDPDYGKTVTPMATVIDRD